MDPDSAFNFKDPLLDQNDNALFKHVTTIQYSLKKLIHDLVRPWFLRTLVILHIRILLFILRIRILDQNDIVEHFCSWSLKRLIEGFDIVPFGPHGVVDPCHFK